MLLRLSAPAAGAMGSPPSAGDPAEAFRPPERLSREGDAAGARRRFLLRPENRGTAARGLREMADNVSAPVPDVVESLSALAKVFLFEGRRSEALVTAREALGAADRWRAALGAFPPWDGTDPGARRSMDALVRLFPYGEDMSELEAAAGRFLRISSLRRRILEAESRARSLGREAKRRSGVVRERAGRVSERRTRSSRLEDRFRGVARRAGELHRNLFAAADNLSLREWGARTDPETAALLAEAAEKLERFPEMSSKVRRRLQAVVGPGGAGGLPPEDRRMAYFALDRLDRAGESAASLEARLALLRAAAWSRWKDAYARRANRLLDETGAAERRAGAEAARSSKTAGFLLDVFGELSLWERALAGMEERMAGAAAVLASRHAGLRAPADEAFSAALRSALPGRARKERALHHLAGRAAAEWILEGTGSPGGSASPPPPGLLPEAIRHLEASLPPAGERAPHTDESLFALAALRFEEATRRYYAGGEGKRGEIPDVSAASAIFRRLLAEFPESPYAEPARYGLAICLDESGAPDNAVLALEELLARHPSTRYRDEANLRIGEHRFDRYDFPGAEEAYRKVRGETRPELRVTALFKLGWSLFLQSRPSDAAVPFLDAALLSADAGGTGGLRDEAIRMTARSLVEAGTDREAEAFLRRRNAGREGPAVLLAIEVLLDAQNRYDEAASVATRLGSAYPAAAERLDAEETAAAALRKAKKDDESMARRATFAAQFAPGGAWRDARGRTAGEIARADAMAMEGLAAAGFHFHAAARANPPGDRRRVLALYDGFLSRFPSSPKAEEVGYQRAWLLYEDGRKSDALRGFEATAGRSGGARGEAARYMAVQCAKELAGPDDAPSQGEVIRLAREYEKAFPAGNRRFPVLLDRSAAHTRRKEWDQAAEAAEAAARIAASPADRRTAHRIAGEARFEGGRYAEAEAAFREALAGDPPPSERAEVERWVGFSMFREAERLPPARSGEAGDRYLRISREFPAVPIASGARFRAGEAYAAAGRDRDAIAAFLAVESDPASSVPRIDATRRLAMLYERTGNPLPAAERLDRLSAVEPGDEGKGRHLFRAAELFAQGKDEGRARDAYVRVSALPGVPPAVRVLSRYRAGESARQAGREDEADAHYDHAVRLHRELGGAAPEIAGRALVRRAEFRYRDYLRLRIVPPLEKTFPAKQRALSVWAGLYAEAVRVGDAATVATSLHRIGEGLEDFRAAILSSPPPSDLSAEEKEEYLFLLEERAAPIEERAVESYRDNLRAAAAVGYFDPLVGKSRERLRALRPAVFGRTPEYAFPVLSVPDFVGITERTNP